MTLTDNQLLQVGQFINANLRPMLVDINIDAIGIAYYGDDHLQDHRICFIVHDRSKLSVPYSYRIGNITVATMASELKKIVIGIRRLPEFIKSQIRPGVNIGTANTIGTLTAIVVNNGDTGLLGCYHTFLENDRVIVQPGRSTSMCDRVGIVTLVSSELDAAFAKLTVTNPIREIVGLNIAPRYARTPDLGEIVTKYGIATYITRGQVRLIHAIRRGRNKGDILTNQLMIVANDALRTSGGEISWSADSGALWMGTDGENVTEFAIGMNNEGDYYSNNQQEYSYATDMNAIMTTLKLNFL